MSLALAALFALAAGFSLFRLAFARHGAALSPALDSREADLSHVVMNGAMAAMAVAPLAGWAHLSLWGLAVGLAAWFAWCLARPRPPGRLSATAYHLVSVLAMIYAMHLLAQGAGPATIPGTMSGMDGMAGHAHHVDRADHAVAGGGIALVLGLAFLLDGALTLGPGLLAPGLVQRATAAMAARADADPAPALSRSGYLQAAFAHVVMDFGMAWLLLA